MKRLSYKTLPIVMIMLALSQLGQGSYIYLKAQLAQWLIASSWQDAQAEKVQIKPWPWADTWPIAKLTVPQHDIEQYVLAGVSGESLAFGPGHVFTSSAPTAIGNTMIAGHRDTHFDFLQQLKTGEVITLENVAGEQRHYIVQDMRIVDKTDVAWINVENHQYQLTLVTCYPFNAVQAGGRLRYVVRALAQADISA